MKLDYEVLSQAPSFVDAVKDRALDLRALKIGRIENLAITKDGHDTIDLTDNELRKLENFPNMKRLKCLLLSNNRINKIDPEVPKRLPNMTALIFTNNQFSELGDLDVLSQFKELTHLSLLDNPVTLRKHYRHYVIFRCPKVRVLDFRAVKDVERKESAELFAGDSGAKLASTLSSTKASAVASADEGPAKKVMSRGPTGGGGLTPDEAARIKAAIKNASSLEEIERLKRQLEGGAIPSSRTGTDSGARGGGGGPRAAAAASTNADAEDEDVDMEED